MRSVPFLVVLLISCPALALADGMENELARVAGEKAPGSRRITLLKPAYPGTLSDWPVELKQGSCYLVAVAGGDGARTFRLSLHDRNGQELRSDLTVRPYASLRHCANYAGPHYVRARITIGRGDYRAAVFEEHAAASAPVAAAAPTAPPTRARGGRAAAPAVGPPPARSAPPVAVAVQHVENRGPDAVDTATQVQGALGNLANIQVGGSRTTTTRTTTTSSNSDAPAPGPGGCDSDFELGSTAMINSRSDIGVRCNDFYAPTNCPTGMYIKLHRPRECFCVARCEEWTSRPAPGQACTQDGAWVCDQYGARNNNHATFCAPASWNLCRR